MRGFNVVTSVSFLCICIAGCGPSTEEIERKTQQVNESLRKSALVEYTGQVFVVTKESQNIKLALVKVAAIPVIAVISDIKSKHVEFVKERNRLLAAELETISAMSAYQNAKRFETTAEDDWLRNLDADSGVGKKHGQFDAARNNSIKMREILGEKVKALETLQLEQAHFNGLGSADHYMRNLPVATAISKSDVDGKFSLTLPPGKYVLAAQSDRTLFEGTASYSWLVILDTSSPNHTIMLSNDNMFETKCAECVIPEKL